MLPITTILKVNVMQKITEIETNLVHLLRTFKNMIFSTILSYWLEVSRVIFVLILVFSGEASASASISKEQCITLRSALQNSSMALYMIEKGIVEFQKEMFKEPELILDPRFQIPYSEHIKTLVSGVDSYEPKKMNDAAAVLNDVCGTGNN
jgi:hypothetical protein